MAENTQEELGKSIEAIEGKKWADIIRHKGFGSLHGVFNPKWQYELNGSMANLVEANTGITPLQFAFVLPLTEGEELERAVVKNLSWANR